MLMQFVSTDQENMTKSFYKKYRKARRRQVFYFFSCRCTAWIDKV